MVGQDGSSQQAAPAQLEAEQLQPARKFYVVHNQNDRGNSEVVPAAPRGRGMIDRTLQARLGSLLRSVFSDVAEEPVPERFVKLLEALSEREKSR